MTETCSTCRFWEQHEDAFEGFCRRLPPATHFRVRGNGNPYDVHAWGYWPDTGPDEWCGEHQPAEGDEEGS